MEYFCSQFDQSFFYLYPDLVTGIDAILGDMQREARATLLDTLSKHLSEKTNDQLMTLWSSCGGELVFEKKDQIRSFFETVLTREV